MLKRTVLNIICAAFSKKERKYEPNQQYTRLVYSLQMCMALRPRQS